MVTLHSAIEQTKTIGKWVFVIALLIGIVFGIYNLIQALTPKKVPPPTVSFGKLPPITFAEAATQKTFSYTLNTVSGEFPSLGDRTNVYKIIQPSSSLLALKNAQDKVSKIGFDSSGLSLSETLYRWNGQVSPFRNLVLDIVSFNFNLSSNYQTDQFVLQSQNRPDENGSIIKATEFLSAMDNFPADIDPELTKTTLLAIQDQDLVPTTSLSSAQIIRVDFFQKKLDEIPIVYSNPPFSTMTFFVGGGEYDPMVVAANYFHQNVDTSSSTTYPIKTSEQAFNDLKEGKGYIASFYGTTSTISIQDIYLGLYMGNEPQSYLLPVFVFEGNDGFFAYVSAIKDEWVNK